MQSRHTLTAIEPRSKWRRRRRRGERERERTLSIVNAVAVVDEEERSIGEAVSVWSGRFLLYRAREMTRLTDRRDARSIIVEINKRAAEERFTQYVLLLLYMIYAYCSVQRFFETEIYVYYHSFIPLLLYCTYGVHQLRPCAYVQMMLALASWSGTDSVAQICLCCSSWQHSCWQWGRHCTWWCSR